MWARMATLRAENARLRADNANLRVQIFALDTLDENGNLRAENANLRAENERLRLTNANLRQHTATQADVQSDMRKTIARLGREAASARQLLAFALKQLARLRLALRQLPRLLLEAAAIALELEKLEALCKLALNRTAELAN